MNDTDLKKLAQAHRQAGLRGTLEEAMADPVLAKCLHNIANAPPPAPPTWLGIDHGSADRTVFIPRLPTTNVPTVDTKRRASGDFD